jgi:hypothetical protein
MAESVDDALIGDDAVGERQFAANFNQIGGQDAVSSIYALNRALFDYFPGERGRRR